MVFVLLGGVTIEQHGCEPVQCFLVFPSRHSHRRGIPFTVHVCPLNALIADSLMNSIVHGGARPTVGTPEEVSTIGIQLQRHPLQNVRVEFYDCAGQIDYAGMHQIFLSRRALYLLVWDVQNCLGRAGNTLDQVGASGTTHVRQTPCHHTNRTDDFHLS